MNILAFDTSTEACSAALSINGEIVSRYELAPRRHAELILPMIDQVLAEAETALTQLDAIAFGRGPGAFTGVRIATGIAQGLAYTTGLPLIAVSSLATLAQAARDRADYIAAAIDARMGEVYFGYYRSADLVQLTGHERVTLPAEINITGTTSCYGIGSGWTTYADTLQQVFGEQLQDYCGESYPDARFMLPLALGDFESGRLLSAEQAAPAYLRDRVTG